MLEISANVMGRASSYHPTLFYNEREAVLADAGFPGQAEAIREEIEAVVPFERLSKVIVTHQDIDHIGGLSDLVNGARHDIEVLAGVEDKPYIEGEKPIIKMTPEFMARMESMIPPEMREQRRQALQELFANPPKARVNRTVTDNEIVDCCGGITIITTPGHTPGHICLYHQDTRTLVAGDAMVVTEGRLMGPSESAAYDLELATKSLAKLAVFDIENVICYHGGLVAEGVNERIAALAAR